MLFYKIYNPRLYLEYSLRKILTLKYYQLDKYLYLYYTYCDPLTQRFKAGPGDITLFVDYWPTSHKILGLTLCTAY